MKQQSHKQDETVIDKDEDSQSIPLAAYQKQKQETEEWKNKYLRALADYQNLVKRTQNEQKEHQLIATELVVKKILPVLDNLERAQDHIKDEGLSIALKEFLTVLKTLGVKKIDTDGKVFDPYTMDCVDVVEGDHDHVVVTIEHGYVMHEKVIRPAKVTVGK